MFSSRNKKDISIFRMKKAPYLLQLLEMPEQDTSNEYLQHAFVQKNEKHKYCLVEKGALSKAMTHTQNNLCIYEVYHIYLKYSDR